MDNTVIRRGIGAVVLALIAALLLGYLLKGKDQERKEVAEMTLPESPIQIFPESKENGDATQAVVATESADAVAQNDTADQASQNSSDDAVSAAVQTTGEQSTAMAQEAEGATTQAVEMANKAVDAEQGNAAIAKGGTVIDQAGQAVVDAGNVAKDGTVNFAIRPNQVDAEVRPSIEGDAKVDTANAMVEEAAGSASTVAAAGAAAAAAAGAAAMNKVKDKAAQVSASGAESASKLTADVSNKLVAEKKRSASTTTRSNTQATKKASAGSIRLVGEKRLPPVKPGVSRKAAVAASAATAAAGVAAGSGAVLGNNSYVIQLLATSDKVKAINIQKTMHSEGYQSFVAHANASGKPIYRVRIGAFSDKSIAMNMQAKMKRRYRKNQYVQGSIVVRQ